MNTTPHDDTMGELISAMLDGALDDEQTRRLDQHLAAGDDVEAYMDWVVVNTFLRREMGTVGAAENSKLEVRNSKQPQITAAERSSWATPAFGSGFRVSSFIAIAALILITAGVLMTVLFFSEPRTLNSEPSPPVTASPVALLTDVRDATFGDSTVATTLGSELTAGRLVLTSGATQVMFHSGAVIDLQGPSEFEVVQSNRGRLISGRMIAHVPESAHGFSVDLPGGLRVVDLGTRFSIELTSGRWAQVYVIDGKVSIERRGDQASPSDQQHVRAGQTARLNLNQRLVESVEASGVSLVANGRACALSGAAGEQTIRFAAPDAVTKSASVFRKLPVDVRGFESKFRFRVDPAGSEAADGFAFVIHTDRRGASAVSEQAGGTNGFAANPQGHGGVESAVAVEFDFKTNPPFHDPPYEHVAVFTDRSADHADRVAEVAEAARVDPVGLVAGAGSPRDRYAWVHYDGMMLAVYLASQPEQPSQPVLRTPIDLSRLVGDDYAYVGFTAAVGAADRPGQTTIEISDWIYHTLQQANASKLNKHRNAVLHGTTE